MPDLKDYERTLSKVPGWQDKLTEKERDWIHSIDSRPLWKLAHTAARLRGIVEAKDAALKEAQQYLTGRGLRIVLKALDLKEENDG